MSGLSRCIELQVSNVMIRVKSVFIVSAGFNIQSASLDTNGWTGPENQSIRCCESYKLRQTVPDHSLLNIDCLQILTCFSETCSQQRSRDVSFFHSVTASFPLFTDLAHFPMLYPHSLCHYVIILSEGASRHQWKSRMCFLMWGWVSIHHPISLFFVPLQVEHLDGLLLHNPLRES